MWELITGLKVEEGGGGDGGGDFRCEEGGTYIDRIQVGKKWETVGCDGFLIHNLHFVTKFL